MSNDKVWCGCIVCCTKAANISVVTNVPLISKTTARIHCKKNRPWKQEFKYFYPGADHHPIHNDPQPVQTVVEPSTSFTSNASDTFLEELQQGQEIDAPSFVDALQENIARAIEPDVRQNELPEARDKSRSDLALRTLRNVPGQDDKFYGKASQHEPKEKRGHSSAATQQLKKSAHNKSGRNK
ncbi:hypothetical protein CEUSTIGMA_g1529.t1 [Chlamydomonas eustigma]|uniref:Uncharacterized protein n=1 Tax=Chlamydomonas eustigma TaxID=1157962 RepID=A0A250WTL6_9CHLO|nr:hypothetical protein CEUSTIGMA_g1529.t1 [Chlamydomonas eustigma]|eukprot:GAX74079.1 hypothetical protein CEUSTIGMA_g1529.t1 [Chlamydomonas eustigma]